MTVSASPSWAETGPAIEKARAAQVAATMVRIFMGFLLLPHGKRPRAGLGQKPREGEESTRTRNNRLRRRHGEGLDLKVDRSGKTTLSQQIRFGVATAIESGVLEPGAHLPSKPRRPARVARGTCGQPMRNCAQPS